MSQRLNGLGFFFHIWHKISHVGITPDMELEQIRRVATLNRVGLIAGLCVVPFCLPIFNPTQDTFGWIEFLSFLGFTSVLFWHMIGGYRIAPVAALLTADFKIFFSASYRGQIAGEQLFFIPLIMGLLLLYNNRSNLPEKYVIWGITLLSFLGLEISGYRLFAPETPFNPSVERQIASLNFAIAATIILAITHYYFRLAASQQAKLKKNSQHQQSLNVQLEEHVTTLSTRNQELKQQEQALIKARDKAEYAARAKSEFLSVMSHELRTPLNAIIGSLDLLVETPLNPEQTALLETVRQGGENLFILLDNILSVSYGEQALLPPVKQDHVEVEALLAATLLPFEQAASQKGIVIHTHWEQAHPSPLVTDQKRLVQVLRNLMSNAVKFTSKGSITLAIQPVEAEGSCWWQFRISDTGVGISQTRLEHVFRPFIQEEAYSHRRHEGAGLGLAVSLQLTKQMGGNIHIHSEPGEGTQVDVTIPMIKQATANVAPGSPISPNEYRILVAEDNAINQKIASRLLKKIGYEFEIVENGKLALQAVMDQTFDLILMDMQMPEVNGLEATQLIRADLTLGKQPTIIAMTANASQSDREACLDAGMDDFLTKPVRKPDLEEMLTKWLGKVAVKG